MLNSSVMNSSVITCICLYSQIQIHTVFISIGQKKIDTYKLILATDEPKQKIKIMNTSLSQNTLRYPMLLNLKVELTLIYILYSSQKFFKELSKCTI